MTSTAHRRWLDQIAACGVEATVAAALQSVFHRDHGLVAFTGPTGMGKKTLAMLCVDAFSVPCFASAIRSVEDARRALELAQRQLVVAVFGSGESVSLRAARLPDIGIPDELVERAAMAVVTQRLLRRPDGAIVYLLEVIAPDGRLLTGTLAEEADGAVRAGKIALSQALSHVPGFKRRWYGRAPGEDG